jgi:hypothetical protein
MRRLCWGLSLATVLGCGPVITEVEDSGSGDGADDATAGDDDGATTRASRDDDGDDDGREATGRDTVGDTFGDTSTPDVPPDPLGFFVRTPEGIVVSVSTFVGASCANVAPAGDCLPYPQWSLSFVLPPEAPPGEYLLTDLNASVSEIGAGSGGDCAGGGGVGVSGVLVLEVVGPTIDGVVFVDESLSGPIEAKFSATQC